MIIAITNQKGGVAKTTTAINLSASLVAAGKKVLLVDIDPQGNATMGSGVNKMQLTNSVFDLLDDADNVAIGDVVLADTDAGYDLVPANSDLTAATVSLLSIAGKETLLHKQLAPVVNRYDYIFIDCPPSLNILTVNAFVAADRVLVPIQCEYYALEGLTDLMETIGSIRTTVNPQLRVEGFVRTLYDSRNSLSKEVSSQLMKYFGAMVYNTIITRNIKLAEAPSFGLPVMKYDRKSSGAVNYYALAGEMLRRHKQSKE